MASIDLGFHPALWYLLDYADNQYTISYVWSKKWISHSMPRMFSTR
jgi:hypothetical protein